MENTLLNIVCDLLRQHSITDFVLCPGTRNAPLTEALAAIEGNKFYVVLDERSAGFVAIGLAQSLKRAVAVCCTSGSAVVNLYPAVVEAHYQEVPIVLLTADRPKAWIDQQDGQTIVQENIFSPHIRYQANCYEPTTETDIWHNNRMVNEALLSLQQFPLGAVHINIPIGNPYKSIDVSKLSVQRKIDIIEAIPRYDLSFMKKAWSETSRRVVVVGQHAPSDELQELVGRLSARNDVVVLAEHIANVGENAIHSFDKMIEQYSDKTSLAPDLLIYLGGHITSKHLKILLRKNKPQTNIYVGSKLRDTFGNLTHFVKSDTVSFLQTFLQDIAEEKEGEYVELWRQLARQHKPPIDNATLEFIDVFVKNMLPDSVLQLANSQTIRNIEHFVLPNNTKVFCNKGTNGIEGSLSTAIGYAFGTDKQVYLIIGDLSFLYDINALSIKYLPKNLTILLINNRGGEIFRNIDGVKDFSQIDEIISYRHQMSVAGWCHDAGIDYQPISNKQQLEQLLQTPNEKAMCIEVVINS